MAYVKEKNEQPKSVQLKIEYRLLSELKPNPKNPRKSTKEAIERLAESIKNNPAFFEARPILLSDRTGELVIIGGERRYEAAEYLQMIKAPTILLHGLSEEKEYEIMTKDNTHAGEWDGVKLAEIAKQWGGEKLKSWAPDLKWDADTIVKSSIPELANLGEESTLDDIFDNQGALARERVIITFDPKHKEKIAEMLHLESIKKVLYRLEELCEL